MFMETKVWNSVTNSQLAAWVKNIQKLRSLHSSFIRTSKIGA